MTVITAVLSLSVLESTEHHKVHYDVWLIVPSGLMMSEHQKAPSAIRCIKTAWKSQA